MFEYSSSVSWENTAKESDVYVKWVIRKEKSNSLLRLIPSMYFLTKENDEYILEYCYTVWFNDPLKREGVRKLFSGTLPINSNALPTVTGFYTPDIYSETLFDNYVLSPFSTANKKYYSYSSYEESDSTVRISFKPKIDNTQLVNGEALTEKTTGKVTDLKLNGEFDMMTFSIDASMNDTIPDLPKNCNLTVYFNFLGNRIRSDIKTVFLPPKTFPEAADSGMTIESIRPMPLTDAEKAIYSRSDSLKLADSTSTAKSRMQKKTYKMAWDIFEKNLLNNFKTSMGQNDEFSLRTSAILNPSFLNYSHNKGFRYRYDILGKYIFTDNSDLNFRIRLGYMFTKKQFFYDAPIAWTFNEKRNGTLKFTIGSGNRITNSSVHDMLVKMNPDSIRFQDMDLKYYTDKYGSLTLSYDVFRWLGLEMSATFHRRAAVNKKEFIEAGQPTVYKTFAPSLEVTLKPFLDNGPICTLDYERGIKGVLGSGVEYERLEGDISKVMNFSPVTSLSFRAGGGIYTDKSRDIYFLDFANFRENNLPGGWNDDWSGEFQLLNSGWYNVSKYYIRANVTFEHPLMFASLIPYFGRYIETERIYVNSLWVDKIHPYMEYGYGFRCRYFSAGLYMSTRNWHYQSFGGRITFELFGRWK